PIQYTVNDTAGNTSNQATVTLSDTASPAANNDTGVFDGTAVTVNADANDGNGEALNLASVQIVGTTNAGDPLVVAGQGTWSVNTINGDITFAPVTGFTGAPTPIQYTVNDTAGNTSNPATVTLSDSAAPAAQNDVGVFTGTAVTVNVDANDGNGEPLDLTSVQIVGTVNPGDPLTVAGQGTWSIHSTNGDITFTPIAGFTGAPAPISYTVPDLAGTVSNPATITLTDAATPVANADTETFTGTPITIAVLTNDGTGEALDPTSVHLVGATNPGDPLVVAGEGTWTPNVHTGALTFTPLAGFTGTPSVVEYTVKDIAGNSSSAISVTLTDGAKPTTANDQGIFDGKAVTVSVIANDGPEALDLGTLELVGSPGPGAPLVVTGQGVWSVDAVNGTVTFTPETGFTGVPQPVQYTVADASGNVATPATVTLTDNVAPVAQDDTAQYTGTATTISVDTNDGAGEPLNPASVQLVGTGTPGEPLSVAGQGIWSVNSATGDLTFTPAAGFTGTPTPVSYTIADTAGNVSNPVVVTLTDNAAPVVSPDTGEFNGDPVTVQVTLNDGHGEALDPASVQIDGTAGPAMSLSVPGQGSWHVNTAVGSITFVPVPGFSGAPSPISYSVADVSGNRSNIATLTLTLGATFDLPITPQIAQPHETSTTTPEATGDQRSFTWLEPQAVLAAVNQAQSLEGLPNLGVDRPLLDAIDDADSLGGALEIDATTAVIDEVERVEELLAFNRPAIDYLDPDGTKFAGTSLDATVDLFDALIVNANPLFDTPTTPDPADTALSFDLFDQFILGESAAADGGPTPDGYLQIPLDGLASPEYLDVRTASGDRLPSWLSFNQGELRLEGEIPPNLQGELELHIFSADELIETIRVDLETGTIVGADILPPEGRASFQAQLESAAADFGKQAKALDAALTDTQG
nr:hypothetical protein [Gammaproteobacteria bacterium]